MAKSTVTVGPTHSTHPYSQRLSAVLGDGGKTNDVFVYGETNSQQHIIYFGGDVQNYPENMDGFNARYLQWNTEKTASLLYRKFPQSLVFAIKAKEMDLKTFARYSNFVDCNELGAPIHCSAYGAARHLTLLYKSACRMVAESKKEQEKRMKEASRTGQCTTVEKVEEVTSLSSTYNMIHNDNGYEQIGVNIPLCIIGFSKGCVVLNQLVHEIPLVIQHDNEVKQLLSKISNLYWLDGGHNGGDVDMSNQHAYITEPHLVASLAELGCHVHVYVTPYQIYDLQRPWLGKQYRRFCQLLQKTKSTFTVTVLFEKEPGSLENHFKILETFKT